MNAEKEEERERSTLTEAQGKSLEVSQVHFSSQPPQITWQQASENQPLESNVISS